MFHMRRRPVPLMGGFHHGVVILLYCLNQSFRRCRPMFRIHKDPPLNYVRLLAERTGVIFQIALVHMGMRQDRRTILYLLPRFFNCLFFRFSTDSSHCEADAVCQFHIPIAHASNLPFSRF